MVIVGEMLSQTNSWVVLWEGVLAVVFLEGGLVFGLVVGLAGQAQVDVMPPIRPIPAELGGDGGGHSGASLV